MTDSPLRAALRARLTRARLDRDRAATATLRSAIAALENAEAVPAGGADGAERPGSEHVAGALLGVGAAEAERRVLGPDEELAVLERERADLLAAAEQYDAAGRPDEAAEARRTAALLAPA